MKQVSDLLKAHLAGEDTTIATLWKIVRTDGQTFCFTDLDNNITYQNEVYKASRSFNISNIKTSSNFEVDNAELTTFLKRKNLQLADFIDGSIINEDDINKGLWDLAYYKIILVNFMDLSMGHMHLRSGKLANIETGRNTVKAESRSKKQHLNQNIGRTYNFECDAKLGDEWCTPDFGGGKQFDDGKTMNDYTRTGSVTTVINQHSWLDDSLTQSNAVNKASITNIQAGEVTKIQMPNHPFVAGDQIRFAGITGSMAGLNGKIGIVTYIDSNNISIALDTTYMMTKTTNYSDNSTTYYNYSYSNSKNPSFNGSTWNTNGGSYTGGGTATDANESEYYQGGIVTWLTGNNAGLSIEVKNYSPKYVFVAERQIGKIQVGDTYRISAGCDKKISTCHERFNNVINHQGFALIPGTDAFLSGS